jgi:hypothetical protein
MSKKSNIENLASEYDMRPSRVHADEEHNYGALFIGPVGSEWELHGFNTVEELNELLCDYLGDEFGEESVDRIVDLNTGSDVEFEIALAVRFS